jgi:hypothetical protein
MGEFLPEALEVRSAIAKVYVEKYILGNVVLVKLFLLNITSEVTGISYLIYFP